MKIIQQSYEILQYDGLELIEQAGRTCYRSEEKIGCTKQPGECCPYTDQVQYLACEDCKLHSSHGFTRGLIKRHHEAMLEFGGATVRFVTDRGVTHELVRHRPCSFAQESTRYCDYGGQEINFIRPVWAKENVMGPTPACLCWKQTMREAERAYNHLLELGWQPEHARTVLPHSLATTIVVKANYREWRHILNLRAVGTTGRPHPQMQALMLPLLREFKQLVPVIFDDLEAK